MTNHHVLTARAAIVLGIVDAAGNRCAHTCTAQEIADAAESSHDTLDAAYAAAYESSSDGRDRWIIDDRDRPHFVAGA